MSASIRDRMLDAYEELDARGEESTKAMDAALAVVRAAVLTEINRQIADEVKRMPRKWVMGERLATLQQVGITLAEMLGE